MISTRMRFGIVVSLAALASAYTIPETGRDLFVGLSRARMREVVPGL